MDTPLIGRKEEKEILLDALSSAEAEMVAVIGRRRVGKTFLVRTAYRDKIAFEITGLQDASKKEQLENFVLQLAEASGATLPIRPPSSWLEAFALLITCTRKQLFLILISTFGLKENQHSVGLVAQALNMDDLFEG